MAPKVSGQTSIFGVVFFVAKSLLGIKRQKRVEKFAILTRKPRSHVRILIYRMWPSSTILGTLIRYGLLEIDKIGKPHAEQSHARN